MPALVLPEPPKIPPPPSQPPAQIPAPPAPPTAPQSMPQSAAQSTPQGAQARAAGAGLRGRILVIEGGYGTSGRRPWARGSGQAPVLSAMLAAVSPQILLAADAVDAVHLPGASDPQTVLAHIGAAARHPGPLLIILGGHLVAERKSEHLYLTLRDSKATTVRQDGLEWQALAGALRHRPAEWDTLVVADLSADQTAWPQVQTAISPLADGVPLWAVVTPDPEQIGIFTRGLIEALHGGQPGAPAVLSPEQLRQQVHSVVRSDSVILTSHAPDRPVFRNTARVIGTASVEAKLQEGPRPAATMPKPAKRPAKQRPAQPRPVAAEESNAAQSAGVSLLKPGVPPTPPRPPRPVSLVKGERRKPGVSLLKALPGQPADSAPGPRPTGVSLLKTYATGPEPQQQEPVDYREAIGRIVRTADGGEHEQAAELALELERHAIAAHGPAAPEALQVRQVRAHVARLAGHLDQAADLYRTVALALLAGQGAEHPETLQIAANAEACWRAMPDRAEAIRIAPEIIEMRAHLPGPDGRRLRAAERYLRQLAAAGQTA